MRRVLIPIFDGVLLLDLSGPAEVFALANRYLPEDQHYLIITVANSIENIRTSNGMRLVPDVTFKDDIIPAHLTLVPGGPGAYNDEQPRLIDWLQKQIPMSKWAGSVCTGAFLLGRAGLLDGKRTTTHWNYTKRLRNEFPRAIVEDDEITTEDGDLVCSGGITTGIDLAFEIIKKDHGHNIAVIVAKTMLQTTVRHGGQLQFSCFSEMALPNSKLFQILINYVKHNIHQKISAQDLANVVSISPRQLARKFLQEADMSPLAFVQMIRLNAAREILETSELPLKTIAHHCGFGSARQLTDLFRKRLGLTPLQYREQFNR